MADDDNFDIDIYGDDNTQEYNQNESEVKAESQTEAMPDAPQNSETPKPEDDKAKQHENNGTNGDQTQAISSTGGSSQNQLQPPKQAPVQQGVKRKEGPDDRPVDANATTALLISELHWWTNEDDIRGWANQSGCEDELVDVTFNEHKVNGKSKGQCFVELSSHQAATALKHTIESFGQGQQYAKKHTAVFHAPHINPYRTLPKDVPNRKEGNQSRGGSFSGSPAMSNSNFHSGGGGGFRGGRGGFNRGGNMGMGYNNRNFSSPMNGGPMGGGFNGPMGGMNPIGGMGAMNNMGFNGFGRGGGMMGMRGGMGPNRGRGGMGGGMNPGMMGGMGPMGAMGAMGMNPGMMGGMNNMGAMGAMGMQATPSSLPPPAAGLLAASPPPQLADPC
ncbi:uncharacterized protein K452DRAFT_305234 [Aplosporella prunicola CBS 121167]|uniref:RRM domain-containing protein n=1 Tax=Aplosporella prunicola CBS 121167 TaxID=1176127 RepID=A0A6A6BS35_9PEZI|nr:uncharacterized protein K452DRAFT_305234 [Aplosporella prunicola CBS 121167]KAF2146283.1 hypothetical protein K452DRAFT_305234 [Aplosporella prunicola CBS 121167]